MTFKSLIYVFSSIFGSLKALIRIPSDLFAVFHSSDAMVEEQHKILKEQHRRYRELTDEAESLGIDMLAVGASSLTAISAGAPIPDDILHAYKLAYPDMSQSVSLSEWLHGKSPEEIEGLAAAIKGKLFEIKYADWLNNGHLPDGYSAHLADAANQPGWDIHIDGPDGNTAHLFQLKATNTASYVMKAIEKHPDIKVVTTDEVFGKIAMHGAAASDHVIGSGIDNVALTDHVHSALDSSHGGGFGIPYIMLAIIGISEYLKPNKSAPAKFHDFGSRVTMGTLASLFGYGISTLTGGGLPVLVAGAMGMRFVIGRGRRRRMIMSNLKRLVEHNERRLKKMEQDIGREKLWNSNWLLKAISKIFGRRKPVFNI